MHSLLMTLLLCGKKHQKPFASQFDNVNHLRGPELDQEFKLPQVVVSLNHNASHCGCNGEYCEANKEKSVYREDYCKSPCFLRYLQVFFASSTIDTVGYGNLGNTWYCIGKMNILPANVI